MNSETGNNCCSFLVKPGVLSGESQSLAHNWLQASTKQLLSPILHNPPYSLVYWVFWQYRHGVCTSLAQQIRIRHVSPSIFFFFFYCLGLAEVKRVSLGIKLIECLGLKSWRDLTSVLQYPSYVECQWMFRLKGQFCHYLPVAYHGFSSEPASWPVAHMKWTEGKSSSNKKSSVISY